MTDGRGLTGPYLDDVHLCASCPVSVQLLEGLWQKHHERRNISKHFTATWNLKLPSVLRSGHTAHTGTTNTGPINPNVTLANNMTAVLETQVQAVRTEHGLQLDQAAGEVVKVDGVVVGVASDQHLIQSVVEFEPWGRQTPQVKQTSLSGIFNAATSRYAWFTAIFQRQPHLVRAHTAGFIQVEVSEDPLQKSTPQWVRTRLDRTSLWDQHVVNTASFTL